MRDGSRTTLSVRLGFIASLLLLASPLAGQFPKSKPLLPVSNTTPSFSQSFGKKTDFLGTEGDPVQYEYSDVLSLALGRGFSANDVTGSPKTACISWKSEQLNPGPPSTDFGLTYVKSSEQLTSTLGVDAKAEASALLGSASLHTKIDTSSVNDRNSITVVISGKTNFGRWGLTAGSSLTDLAKQWLATPAVFSERCGSRYVTWEERGASISAIVTLLSVSSQVKESFEADMAANGGWGPLSAKANAAFRTAAGSSASQDRLQVQVFATGGPGIGGLGDSIKQMMKASSGVDQTLAALGTFLNGFTKENAAVTRYRVASMEDYGWNPAESVPWTDVKQEKLAILAEQYRRTERNLGIARSIVAGTHPLSKVFLPADLEWLKTAAIPQAQLYADSIKKNHPACKSNRSDTVAECDLPHVYASDIERYLHLDLLDPPKFTIYMVGLVGDHELVRLTEEQARLLLNAPKANRINIAKVLNSRITELGATIMAGDCCTFSSELKFIGQTDVDSASITGEMPAQSPTASYSYYMDPAIVGRDDVETVFRQFMAEYWGSHKGEIVWIIKDKMGRRFTLTLANVAWISNKGALTNVSYDLAF